MSVFGRKYAQLSKPNFVSYVDGNYAVSGEGRHIATDQVYVGKFTDDSRTHKTIRAGWFAQQAAMLCFFIYIIADVNLGYMHLSTKYYTL